MAKAIYLLNILQKLFETRNEIVFNQKIEIAGVALKVPIPKERNEVIEVTVIALPASSSVKAILFSGSRLRFVSCHAPKDARGITVEIKLRSIPSIT